MANKHLAELTKNLSPEQRGELNEFIRYTESVAKSGKLPEGSAAAVISRLSKPVQGVIHRFKEVMDTPRHLPYETKLNETQKAEAFGMDPTIATGFINVLDAESAAARLQERMGTDADLPAEPLSQREIISAAFDAHNSGE